MKVALIRLSIVSACMIQSQPLLAKGLDELTPETKTESPPAAEEKTSGTDENATSKETPAEEPKGKEAEKEPEAKEVKAEAKAIEPSALSKKMADKLFLGTGIYFGRLEGSKGDWTTSSHADVWVGHLIKSNPFPKGPLAKVDFHGTYRYAPVDVTVKADGQSYRGVVQGHYFGAMLTRNFSDSFRTSGGLEVGYMVTNLTSTDNFELDEDLEKSGMNFDINFGADWIFWKKVAIGPRLHKGFGSFQTFSLGAATNLVF